MNPTEKSRLDIQEIRNIMDRSTKFLSLSGLAGVFIGLVAMVSAYIGFTLLKKNGEYSPALPDFEDKLPQLLLLGLFTAAISILVAYYFSRQNAKRQNLSVWNAAAKNLLTAMVVPLTTGLVFCFGAVYQAVYWMVFPATLIFYGLALVHAGRYTHKDVYFLGVSEIVLGLVSLFLQKYNLVFWVIGFGVLHIVYGVLMYFKYERTQS